MNFKSLLIAMGAMVAAGTISASAQTYVYEVDQEVTYNHKIYKVTGENIVANSTFADGTYTGWVSTDAGNAVDASAWEISNDGPNGVNYLHNTGAVGGGSGTANNIRCAWDLEAGKTYLASYYTKGSNANVRFWNSALEGVKTPDNPLALLEGTNSADWMQNMVVFEATEEAHKALLNCAWCGNVFGLTYINIVPVEQTGEEEVELTTIEPDTYYYLQIDTFDLYLSAGWQDEKQQVNTLKLGQPGYEQIFKFVPVADKEGVYNIVGLDGKAIWASGGWDCYWNSEPTEENLAKAEYQFTVESEVGYILIKTKNQYIGSDGIWEWSKVWTNKGLDKAVKFVPEKYIPYVTVEPDVYYNLQIQDTTNPVLYFSAGWQDNNRQVNTLGLGEAGYEQAFKFVAVPDTVGVYNIIGLDGKAIYASGGWDCFWNDAPTEENLASAAYQFTVESQKGYMNIMSKNGYIGSDGMWNWSKLYTNKGIDKAVNFVPFVVDVTPAEEYTVYFDNSASLWETVYAYAWAGETNNTWPGQEMTKGENDVWSITFTDFVPENIIFNNGGNGKQTEDLVFENGKTYVGEAPASAKDLYLRGSMSDWGTSMKFDTADEVVYTITIENAVAAGAEFKIANADWSVAYTYDAAPVELNVEYTFIDGNGGPANTTTAVEIPAGAKMTFNAETLAFIIGVDFDGINAINADSNVEYYNMQGVRVANPAAGQPCIRVANGTAAKVIIR